MDTTMGWTTPTCDVPVAQISTWPGEMLIIHEWTRFMLHSNCFDMENPTLSNANPWLGQRFLTEVHESDATSLIEYGEYRVPGHSMSCIHTLFLVDLPPHEPTIDNADPVWSIAYSIRDMTFVNPTPVTGF